MVLRVGADGDRSRPKSCDSGDGLECDGDYEKGCSCKEVEGVLDVNREKKQIRRKMRLQRVHKEVL